MVKRKKASSVRRPAMKTRRSRHLEKGRHANRTQRSAVQGKRKPFRATSRKARPRSAPKATSAYDIEGLLVDKLLERATIAENGTSIENLLYNATHSMEEMGYTFGFSVGREIALKQQGREEFTKALARIGLHEALYHPFEDRLIVTSKHTDRLTLDISKSIHIYEAGVIAGYLSSSTGVRITAREQRCVYHGADACQFIATPFSDQRIVPTVSISAIEDSIANEIIHNDFKRLDNEYYRILAYLPLLKQPIFDEVRKLLVLVGERIATLSGPDDADRIINNIANYFGATSSSTLGSGRGKRIIRLTFDSYNSVYQYALIPTALISGFLSALYNKTTVVNVLTNKDNTYTTTIELER